MNPDLRPSPQEVRNWTLYTLKHSCQVEYYLTKLNLGSKDPQRPHDIVGEGNKYSWPVIKGIVGSSFSLHGLGILTGHF